MTGDARARLTRVLRARSVRASALRVGARRAVDRARDAMDEDGVEGVCFDPDAYDARAEEAEEEREGTGEEDEAGAVASSGVADALARAAERAAADVRVFESLLLEKFPGTMIADVRWERALMKIQRDARFGALRTHAERRNAFESLVRRKREEKSVGTKKIHREIDPEERAMRAIRAREAEAAEAKRQSEREAKRQKSLLAEHASEDSFRALCAERVKTYTRSYEEAFEDLLAGDPMGRDDVSALRGGEGRARELYEEHRASVERTLKAEYEKLAKKLIDRLVVDASSDEVALIAAKRDSSATLDSAFAGAVSYARCADEEGGVPELVDDVLFAFVADVDKEKIWNACARDILARHGIDIVDDDETTTA